MSHPPLSASVNDNHAASASQASPLPRPAWLREPLLHFLLLGAILFGVDHYLVTRVDDPRTIVVGAAVDDEAKQLFKASRGRDPNAEELAALRRVWLDNEVLYREGLILQMDKGDSAIRERVIFKALSVVDANTKLPPVTEEVLRTWFDARRAKYDEPPRFDFQEAVLSGDASEAGIRAFVDKLNAGTPGEAEAGLRVFKGRPRSNVEQSYGPGGAGGRRVVQRRRAGDPPRDRGDRVRRVVAAARGQQVGEGAVAVGGGGAAGGWLAACGFAAKPQAVHPRASTGATSRRTSRSRSGSSATAVTRSPGLSTSPANPAGSRPLSDTARNR